MKSKVIFALLQVCFAASLAGSSFGSCIDLPTPVNPNDEYAFSNIKPPEPVLNELGVTSVKIKLESNSRIRIKLDAPLSTDFVKSNDQVPFSVVENVYVNKPAFTANKPGGGTVNVPAKRCLVIPKDTKLFGLVDYAKPSYPFYFRGKARLYVFVSTLRLEDGTVVNIDFEEPERIGSPNKPVIKDCKREPGTSCITGRRTKLKFSPAIVAVGAGTGIAISEDEDSKDIIALGFVQSLASATGVDSLVNPPNAALVKDMIFDVVTKSDVQIWVSTAKPEPPKK